MESTILILTIIIISYFISNYFIVNYFQSNSTTLKILFGLISFCLISYVYACLQKSGPQRAIFIESIVILIMLPLLPFILLYRYLFEQ